MWTPGTWCRMLHGCSSVASLYSPRGLYPQGCDTRRQTFKAKQFAQLETKKRWNASPALPRLSTSMPLRFAAVPPGWQYLRVSQEDAGGTQDEGVWGGELAQGATVPKVRLGTLATMDRVRIAFCLFFSKFVFTLLDHFRHSFKAALVLVCLPRFCTVALSSLSLDKPGAAPTCSPA